MSKIQVRFDSSETGYEPNHSEANSVASNVARCKYLSTVRIRNGNISLLFVFSMSNGRPSEHLYSGMLKSLN